jgi:hypothetical protein
VIDGIDREQLPTIGIAIQRAGQNSGFDSSRILATFREETIAPFNPVIPTRGTSCVHLEPANRWQNR